MRSHERRFRADAGDVSDGAVADRAPVLDHEDELPPGGARRYAEKLRLDAVLLRARLRPRTHAERVAEDVAERRRKRRRGHAEPASSTDSATRPPVTSQR